MGRIDISDLWWTSLGLLGFDSVEAERKHRVRFHPAMFQTVNRPGVQIILQFLFELLDPERARKALRFCWPVTERTHETMFREAVSSWLADLVTFVPDIGLSNKATAVLVSPSGYKVNMLLYRLTSHAMRVLIEHHAPNAPEEVLPLYKAAPPPPGEESARAAEIRAHCERLGQRFIAKARESIATQQSWKDFAAQTTRSFNAVQRARKEVQEKLAKLPKGIGSEHACAVRDARAAKVRAVWANASRFVDESSDARSVLEAAIARLKTKGELAPTIDGAQIKVQVPLSIVQEAERSRPDIQNIYQNGALDLTSLAQLWSVSLSEERKLLEGDGNGCNQQIIGAAERVASVLARQTDAMVTAQKLDEELRGFDGFLPTLESAINDLQVEVKALQRKAGIEGPLMSPKAAAASVEVTMPGTSTAVLARKLATPERSLHGVSGSVAAEVKVDYVGIDGRKLERTPGENVGGDNGTAVSNHLVRKSDLVSSPPSTRDFVVAAAFATASGWSKDHGSRPQRPVGTDDGSEASVDEGAPTVVDHAVEEVLARLAGFSGSLTATVSDTSPPTSSSSSGNVSTSTDAERDSPFTALSPTPKSPTSPNLEGAYSLGVSSRSTQQPNSPSRNALLADAIQAARQKWAGMTSSGVGLNAVLSNLDLSIENSGQALPGVLTTAAATPAYNASSALHPESPTTTLGGAVTIAGPSELFKESQPSGTIDAGPRIQHQVSASVTSTARGSPERRTRAAAMEMQFTPSPAKRDDLADFVSPSPLSVMSSRPGGPNNIGNDNEAQEEILMTSGSYEFNSRDDRESELRHGVDGMTDNPSRAAAYLVPPSSPPVVMAPAISPGVEHGGKIGTLKQRLEDLKRQERALSALVAERTSRPVTSTITEPCTASPTELNVPAFETQRDDDNGREILVAERIPLDLGSRTSYKQLSIDELGHSIPSTPATDIAALKERLSSVKARISPVSNVSSLDEIRQRLSVVKAKSPQLSSGTKMTPELGDTLDEIRAAISVSRRVDEDATILGASENSPMPGTLPATVRKHRPPPPRYSPPPAPVGGTKRTPLSDDISAILAAADEQEAAWQAEAEADDDNLFLKDFLAEAHGAREDAPAWLHGITEALDIS